MIEAIKKAVNKLITQKHDWIKECEFKEIKNVSTETEVVVTYILDRENFGDVDFGELVSVFDKTKNVFKMLTAAMDYRLSMVKFDLDGKTISVHRN